MNGKRKQLLPRIETMESRLPTGLRVEKVKRGTRMDTVREMEMKMKMKMMETIKKTQGTQSQTTPKKQRIRGMAMIVGMMTVQGMVMMLGVRMTQSTTPTSTPATHPVPNLLRKTICYQSLSQLLQLQKAQLRSFLTRVQATRQHLRPQKKSRLRLLQKTSQQITQQTVQQMINLHFLHHPALQVLMILLSPQKMRPARRLQETPQPVHQEVVQQCLNRNLFRINLLLLLPLV
jgi:hypothetical protein